MKLPTEVITYVAENITSNVRQLEGTVNKIMAYTNMNDFEMNRTNVSRAIKDMFKGKESFLPTPQLVISEVSSYYNISESILRGKARDKTTAEARQVSMYLIRNLTSLSLEDIALEFGKDHSTVLHSINKIESALPGSKHLQTVIREITINVNGRL